MTIIYGACVFIVKTVLRSSIAFWNLLYVRFFDNTGKQYVRKEALALFSVGANSET